jgi:ankyrin repeat protein
MDTVSTPTEPEITPPVESPKTMTEAPTIARLFLDEVLRGRVGHLQLLIDKGGVDINIRNKGANTYLHMACIYGHEKVVSFLIRNGADLNLENNQGCNALHVCLAQAAHKRYERIIRTLLVHGIDVHAMSRHGKIAIHTAVSSASTAVVQILLNFGAGISDIDFMGHNAFHFAAIRTHGSAAVKHKICKILLDHCHDAEMKRDCLFAEIDMDSEFDDSEDEDEDEERPPFTPHHLACIYGHDEVALMMEKAMAESEQEGIDICVAEEARALEKRRANQLAFVMGKHDRIGEKSLVQNLPIDVMQIVLQHV